MGKIFKCKKYIALEGRLAELQKRVEALEQLTQDLENAQGIIVIENPFMPRRSSMCEERVCRVSQESEA